ncbi:YugN family protein [Salinibacillus xinjiangensis]|uniref:YugN-like family protein n=1 Tax=Salinibacillus xinjiangensis TaxID=1229268 RepID=A0A6G1X3I8_9BACI|nr:YugN family protein [Salinibacillus xinjiangensis]MRG85524.1 hypothetical protein [Salinibacillus xinjiangensis]
MRLEGHGIEDAVVELRPLDHLMENAGMIRASGWDYERVTYDYKMDTPVKNETFYLRIQGYAVEGDVDKGNAVIKLLTPLLGKHYYPHGVEYGDGEDFPQNIVEKSNQILKKVKEQIDQFKVQENA